MTATADPGDREDAAISAANSGRRQCICQEDDAAGPCECGVPVTREQAGRLRAYAARHPERAFIRSDLAGAWLSALRSCLPPGEDPVLAWLLDPYGLPPAADLRSAADLGELLDTLGAPPAPTAPTHGSLPECAESGVPGPSTSTTQAYQKLGDDE